MAVAATATDDCSCSRAGIRCAGAGTGATPGELGAAVAESEPERELPPVSGEPGLARAMVRRDSRAEPLPMICWKSEIFLLCIFFYVI